MVSPVNNAGIPASEIHEEVKNENAQPSAFEVNALRITKAALLALSVLSLPLLYDFGIVDLVVGLGITCTVSLVDTKEISAIKIAKVALVALAVLSTALFCVFGNPIAEVFAVCFATVAWFSHGIDCVEHNPDTVTGQGSAQQTRMSNHYGYLPESYRYRDDYHDSWASRDYYNRWSSVPFHRRQYEHAFEMAKP